MDRPPCSNVPKSIMMFNRSALLVALVVYSLVQQHSCLPKEQKQDTVSPSASEGAKKSPDESPKSTPTPHLDERITDLLSVGSRSLEPWLKSMAGLTKGLPGAEQGSNDPFGSIMNLMKPPTVAPTTTTTTPAPAPVAERNPIQQLASGLGSIPASLSPDQLFETPSKVVGALTNTFNLSRISEEPQLKELARVGEQTSKAFTKLSGIRLTAPAEDETVYYEYAPSDEWDGHRRPKYFSKECNFRVSCEIGRMMKPMLAPVAEQFKTNKIVQDLQSRYSRAMAYGILNENCEKYYCVFLQLFGGPQKFVAATAEIVSRVASPEPET